MTLPKLFSFLLSVILTAVFIISCEDRTINPFEEEAGNYAVYGALDLDKNPNYIRIKDLQSPFLADTINRMDATVRFEDLQEGTNMVLEDTIVEFSGNYTYNYIVNESLEPRKQYRLTIEAPNGETVTSRATTPGITEAIYIPNEIEDCEQLIEFRFGNVKSPEHIRMEVGFQYQGATFWGEVGTVAQLEFVSFAEDDMRVTLNTRNLLVDVFPPTPEATVGRRPKDWQPSVRCRELDTHLVQIRYVHFGPEWDVLRRPGWNHIEVLESGDVENGAGFFGAIRRGSYTYTFENP